MKITYSDIKYIYENEYSSWRPIDGFPIEKYYYFMIGSTSKSQFFELALNYNPDENKINFNQIQYANESDIKRHYCG